jgi:hypothetical protein
MRSFRSSQCRKVERGMPTSTTRLRLLFELSADSYFEMPSATSGLDFLLCAVEFDPYFQSIDYVNVNV